jgi:phosphatidate cytidylyltransferase
VASTDPALNLRVSSALLLASLALALVWWGVWPTAILAGALCILLASEWRRLMAARLGGRAGDLAALLAGGATLVVILLAALGEYALAIGLLGLAAVAGAGLGWQRCGQALWPALGVLYLGLPMFAVVWLRALPDTGLGLIVWLLLVVWTTDSAAYFVGRQLGGPKLLPRISPSKTWSGLFGGMLGAALIGGMVAGFGGPFRWLPAALLAASLAVIAQAGDRFEPLPKRRAGVKASGSLSPGPGGVFDRRDGLLFAAPGLAAVVWLSLGTAAGAAA